MSWLKYKFIYFTISMIVLSVGIFSMLRWGFNIGIDFTGGVVAEYKMPNGEIIKVTDESLREEYKGQGAEEVRFEKVGPSIGPELVKKTIYALVTSAILILLWVAYQFKSIKFGVAATLATLHDSLVLLGMFSLLGHFFGAEIDFLFVTAMLTILSFSVHDTIVVFDRIRENSRKSKEDLKTIANKALTQTLVRSINNSATIIFMLLALILMGGDTIKWFAVALLIGTISGTYSSPFVAVPILVTWDELASKSKSPKI